MTFQYLNKLEPFINESFEEFYEAMLYDVRLSVFFENEKQIIMLVKKQKEHFIASLKMPKEILKQTYIKLGEFHYDLRIPYIDFIKGTEILEEHFLLSTRKVDNSIELMDEIFEYFKIMKAFTAKGYLHKMLEEDKKDIEVFFEQTENNHATYLPKAIILEKIQWLKELLESIESNSDFNLKTKNSLLHQWLNEIEFLTFEKRNFFEDIEQRILINTQNLFYFLKREEYLEILPLYSSLLNIYKLTLMMNNAITIEYANKLIEDMQLDNLTGLLKKDIFNEILKKEIELLDGTEEYFLSITYLDLDNFEIINESYGHYTGDKVLEKLADFIRKNIRSSDIAFRIDGDRFAILFKNTTKKTAKKVCNKIKVDFSSYEFVFNNEITFHVSFSAGISEFPHQAKKNTQEFIDSITKKLNTAKEKGKNQIIL
jgi:diguanylate cyclase (GGDEF)-like protein